MHKKNILQLLLLFLLGITLDACHKTDNCPPDLPCATQNGENTFGCYINRKPWVAKIEPFILDPTVHDIQANYDETGYGTFNNNFFSVLGAYYGDTSSSLQISFLPLTRTGKIDLNDLNLYRFRFRTSTTVFDIDNTLPYEIEITQIDTVSNIISGIFNFTGISNSDTIKVTDGRFDVKYGPE